MAARAVGMEVRTCACVERGVVEEAGQRRGGVRLARKVPEGAQTLHRIVAAAVGERCLMIELRNLETERVACRLRVAEHAVRAARNDPRLVADYHRRLVVDILRVRLRFVPLVRIAGEASVAMTHEEACLDSPTLEEERLHR